MPQCSHNDPESFKPGARQPDGRVRMTCPNCFKFMGYTASGEQLKKMKVKGRGKGKAADAAADVS